MSLRTPLGKVRGLGSAKDGTHHWWIQRLTAVALIPLILWFCISLICIAPGDYQATLAWAQSPFVAVLLILLIVAGLHHAQLGVQVVIEDYVHLEWLKVATLIVVKFAAAVLGLTAIVAVLKIGIGS